MLKMLILVAREGGFQSGGLEHFCSSRVGSSSGYRNPGIRLFYFVKNSDMMVPGDLCKHLLHD